MKSETSNGTYMAVRVSATSSLGIRSHLADCGIETVASELEPRLHCTVIYSRKPCPDMINDIDRQAVHLASFLSWEVFTGSDGSDVLVMVLKCPSLVARHKYLMRKHEATYDFPEYHPHITVSCNYAGKSPWDIRKFPGIIVLEEEYLEDLK